VTLYYFGKYFTAPAFWEKNGNVDIVMVINTKGHASLQTSIFLMIPHPNCIPVAAAFILY